MAHDNKCEMIMACEINGNVEEFFLQKFKKKPLFILEKVKEPIILKR